MLNWDEKFATGHSMVDCQHRMLFAYLNRLEHITLVTNPTMDELELFLRFVDFLETYVLTHFRQEEECMLQYRCPAHAANQQAHAEFLEYFRRYKQRLDAKGCRLDALKELHAACRAWIESHILTIDQRLTQCLGHPAAGAT
jgi:hemerythrin-like metal-binding protein